MSDGGAVAQALGTTLTSDGAEACRRCCGGHGYSLLSGLPTLFTSYVQNATWEGDNNVLYLQVGPCRPLAHMHLSMLGLSPWQVHHIRRDYHAIGLFEQCGAAGPCCTAWLVEPEGWACQVYLDLPRAAGLTMSSSMRPSQAAHLQSALRMITCIDHPVFLASRLASDCPYPADHGTCATVSAVACGSFPLLLPCSADFADRMQ